MLMLALTFAIAGVGCSKSHSAPMLTSQEKADKIIRDFSPVQEVMEEPAAELLTLDQVNTLFLSCRENGIPFSKDLLLENLPVNGPCNKTREERYRSFISAFSNRERATEGTAIESFVNRSGKTALRDANAAMVATVFANYGATVSAPGDFLSYDYNRFGVSDGRILLLDLILANQAFSSTATDNFIEFEPDCIEWLAEVSGGNWLIGTTCPIVVNGVAYGPFNWDNPLVYDPTMDNEEFNACGQLISFVDGNIIGPIGGGVTSFSVFNVVPPTYQWTCDD